MTLGTDTSSFIVLGSMMTRFRQAELQFILGREMGHCRAGHALWKTIVQLTSGHIQTKQPLLGKGVLQLLHPSQWIESAIDAPLMAWARHAAITADRAGLLAAGKQESARRVFLTTALRLFPIYDQINMEAWLEQEAELADMTTQFSEWTSTSTPYLNRRLQLMTEFAKSDGYREWRTKIDGLLELEMPPRPKGLAPPDPNMLRLRCSACQEPIKFPKSAAEGRTDVSVRCPVCKAVSRITVH